LFKSPEVWNVEIPAEDAGPQHTGILQNFVDAILTGAPLIAPAREGIHSVELGNAMLYSTWTGDAVKLPMDGALFEKELQKRIKMSRYGKKAVKAAGPVDMQKSFARP
jgi:hypothetical protein